MIKIKESEVQAQIVEYLMILENQNKLFFQRTNNVGIYDPKTQGHRRSPKGVKKGFPDVVVIIRGKFVGIELKSSKGRQSKEQKEMEKNIKLNGGFYFLVRSIKDLEEALKKVV